jgi:FkbM family methyltransferase
MKKTARVKRIAVRWIPPAILDFFRRLAGPGAAGSASGGEGQILDGLAAMQPMQPTEVQLNGQCFRVVDGPSFAWLYREQFHQEVFRFESSAPRPLMLDCGANVGVVTAYLKNRFPEARVIAFEPDPDCFAALQHNCRSYSGVETVAAAVWISEGELEFDPVGAVGGHVAELSGRNGGADRIRVKAVRLRDYLAEPVEFLKMDIEGSELAVLEDCRDRLAMVRFLFVEFHSFEGKPQNLGRLVQILEDAGFRLHAHGSMEEPQPFLRIPVHNRKDFRLNLFAYRL